MAKLARECFRKRLDRGPDARSIANTTHFQSPIASLAIADRSSVPIGPHTEEPAVTLRTRSPLRLNLLESRIAPASVFRYTDVDGDRVTVTSSVGDLTAGGVATVGAGQLRLLDLTGGAFAGANLAFSVAKVPGGDGLANVGYINSTGNNLGTVTVKGDLGRIKAGDDTETITAGLKSLSVRSIGRLGTDTQAGGGDLTSDILGKLGALAVTGDVKDAFIRVTGGPYHKIGAISIGGSLIGGSNLASGEILCTGDIGQVKIGHDVLGVSSTVAGRIFTGGKLAGVSIGGSLIAGSGARSGEIINDIEGGDMGQVKIGHDVH